MHAEFHKDRTNNKKKKNFFWCESVPVDPLKRLLLKVALDGGTRPGDTLQIHPHFLSLMGDGQANAFRWRDTSPRQPCQLCYA